MPVVLPDYFKRSGGMQVTQNSEGAFDLYSAQRPVKSQSSKMQEEFEKCKTENAKLRKKIADL